MVLDKALLRSQLDSLYGDIDKAKEQVIQYEDLTKQIKNLEKDKEAVSTEISGLQTKKADAAKNLQLVEQELTKVKAGLQEEVDGGAKELKDLEVSFGMLNTKRSSLEEDLNKLDSQKFGKLQELTALEQSVVKKTEVVAKLQEELSKLEQAKSSLQNDVNALQVEVDSLREVVDRLGEKKKSLEKLEAELEADIRKLQADKLLQEKTLQKEKEAHNEWHDEQVEEIEKKQIELQKKQEDLDFFDNYIKGKVTKIQKYQLEFEKHTGKRLPTSLDI